MNNWEVTELTSLGTAFTGSGSTKLNLHSKDTAGLPARQLYKKSLISGSVTELGVDHDTDITNWRGYSGKCKSTQQ